MSITIATNNIASSGTLTLNNRALSDVAFTGSYDDLIDKPNTGSGGQLIESYYNNGEWYRVYDDGWIEQGGYRDIRANAIVTVTLHKQFSDTSYSAHFTQIGTTWINGGGVQVNNKTTSTFGIRVETIGNDASAPTMNWIAYGK